MILLFSELGRFDVRSPLTWDATSYYATVLELGSDSKYQFAEAIKILESFDKIVIDHYSFKNERELVQWCKNNREPKFRPHISLHNICLQNSPRQAAWYQSHFAAWYHVSYNIKNFSPQDLKYQLNQKLPPLLNPKNDVPLSKVSGLHRVAFMPHIFQKIIDNLHEPPQGETCLDKIQASIKSSKNLQNLKESSPLLHLKIRLL